MCLDARQGREAMGRSSGGWVEAVEAGKGDSNMPSEQVISDSAGPINVKASP